MECPQATSSKGARVNKRKQPKSRNGCLRCKNKRLKCDETKPACLQCVSRNSKCGYGVQPLIWSTRHEKVILPESNFVDEENHTLEDLISNARKAIAGSSKSSSPESVREQAVLESIETEEIDSNSPPLQDQPVSSPLIRNSPRPQPREPKTSLSVVRERLQQSTVPDFMVHLPSELVYYYFSQVCKIFSSFDGSLNPFRTTISKLFQSSAPIYYGIQAMAAAYLSNHFPRMAVVGVQMQQEAFKCLYQTHLVRNAAGPDLDKVLLGLLLVGQTTSWHNTSDLGLQHLDMAKRLNKRRTAMRDLNTNRQAQRQNQFFDQCLLYWDMVASYVADRDDELEFTREEESTVFPHPWTGVAAEIQNMFCQVGRLVRQFRRTTMNQSSTIDILMLDLSSDTISSSDSTTQTFEIIMKAQALEEKLLSFELPSLSNIVDSGDENTPPHHYILLAEAHRCAALLEIYRVFPSIFHQRTPLTDFGATDDDVRDGTSQQFFNSLNSSPCLSPSEWLVSLAIHTLSLLEQIPITSGTRCVQPLIFVVAAAELRFPSATSSPFSMPIFAQPAASSIFSSISQNEIEIAHMRQFVTARIQEFKQNLPAKPIFQAERIILETWRRSDLGEDVFWLDVMGELGCETIFC